MAKQEAGQGNGAAAARKPPAPAGGDAAAMAEDTFAKMLRVLRMMQANLQQLEAAQGLSGAQLLALWQLSVKAQMSVSELASALHLQRSSTSNLLDKLEARGLVLRSRNEQDQRIVIIRLTDEGRDVVRRVPGPMGGRLRQTIKGLPPRTMSDLHAGVCALIDALEGAEANPAETVPPP